MIVAQRIRKALRKRAAEVWPDLDISIGVALYPDHGRDEDELIQTADRALYGAKRGRKKIRVGEEDSRLGEHIFNIVFQPVVDVSSGEMLGYEALSRDPQGLISVADLFKQYAALGQLTELKQLIFKTQIERASGLGLKRLFINADFDMLGHLEPIARPGGLDVIIELSELEPLQNPENHLKVATAWREEGYRFAIDDFGAGYVSLPFIARLMPEYIKVDRGTILHAVDSDQFRRFLGRLLRAVETYASEGIIAEGIEQNTELQAVRELGISLVQGFLFGEPRPLDQQEAGAGLDRHVLTTH